MLADKLLQNLDYTTDKEVQTLELLKLRFGEENLQPCEIMVLDVEDSKRINLNIRKPTLTDLSDSEMEFEIDAVIVSHHFWPPFQVTVMRGNYILIY
jgi:anaphase-promoting complex subunit 2